MLKTFSPTLLQVTNPGRSVVIMGRPVVCIGGSRVHGLLLAPTELDPSVTRTGSGGAVIGPFVAVLEKDVVELNCDDDENSLSAKWLKSVGGTLTIVAVGFGLGFGDVVVWL